MDTCAFHVKLANPQIVRRWVSIACLQLDFEMVELFP